jgi:hypothetical protein
MAESKSHGFIKAIFSHWIGIVGGSAVFIIATTVLPQFGVDVPKYCMAIGVFLAFLWGCYRAWKDESDKVEKLESRLKPRLKLTCDGKDSRSKVKTTLHISEVSDQHISEISAQPANWFRIVLETEGPSQVPNCCGVLKEIKKDDKVLMGHEAIGLKFVSGDNADESRKTIYRGIPAFLDVLAATAENKVLITTPGLILPSSINVDEIFKEFGTYSLIVVIGSDVSIKAELAFDWRGNWETADLKLVRQVTLG